MYDNEIINNLYVDGDNNNIDSNMTNTFNMSNNNMGMGMPNPMNMNNMMAPVEEAVQEKCVHRTIVHDVPHVCPIHTRVINHHVYRHTYQPRYTCSEENVVSNVECGSCCNY